jgi:hypothetical protein
MADKRYVLGEEYKRDLDAMLREWRQRRRNQPPVTRRRKGQILTTGVKWDYGTLDESLSHGGSADATVNGETVTIYDKFLASGESLDSGATVGITWHARDGKWYVTEAVC